MFSQIVGWILKSKVAKVGVGAIGGSGLLALIFLLHTDVKAEIEKQDVRQKEHVRLMIVPVQVQMQSLQKQVTETKTMVRDIHNHLLKNK